MERFLIAVLFGGISLISGLWISELSPFMSAIWIVGIGFTVAGLASLTAGIWLVIET